MSLTNIHTEKMEVYSLMACWFLAYLEITKKFELMLLHLNFFSCHRLIHTKKSSNLFLSMLTFFSFGLKLHLADVYKHLPILCFLVSFDIFILPSLSNFYWFLAQKISLKWCKLILVNYMLSSRYSASLYQTTIPQPFHSLNVLFFPPTLTSWMTFA